MVKIINGRKKIEKSLRETRGIVLCPINFGIEQNEVIYCPIKLFTPQF